MKTNLKILYTIIHDIKLVIKTWIIILFRDIFLMILRYNKTPIRISINNKIIIGTNKLPIRYINETKIEKFALLLTTQTT